MFKVLDLFSGAGGMAEGFLQAGFSIPYASDKSEQAAQTYKHRHNQLGHHVKFYCGDVVKLAKPEELVNFLGGDSKKIDVVCGGPPCQGFSTAGKRDPNDFRNKLVRSYINILSQVKPKYFVMENVIGIMSSNFVSYQGIEKNYTNAKVVDVLLSEFSKIGYPDVLVQILDASDFGVPQKRKRVIFLGTRKNVKAKLKHPVNSLKVAITAADALDDLMVAGNKSKNKIKELTSFQKESIVGRTPSAKGKPFKAVEIKNHELSKHSESVTRRFSLLKQGENIKNMLERLPVNIKADVLTKKQNCRRIVEKLPSPTVLTLPDDLVHYSENRILSVREMARLQSFDDSFEFLGKRTTGGDRRKSETPQYTLVGNAVPPLLAKAIASEIIKNLRAGN